MSQHHHRLDDGQPALHAAEVLVDPHGRAAPGACCRSTVSKSTTPTAAFTTARASRPSGVSS